MENILPTVQDEYLYGLCRPERLMDIIFNFVLFDNGEKKIARYQQFFAVKKSMQRILQVESDGKEEEEKEGLSGIRRAAENL